MRRIIVQEMNIHRRAQIHYFQVTMPTDVIRITGIRVGVRVKGFVKTTVQQWQMGTLSLQAEGHMNLCYHQAVIAEPVETAPYDLGFQAIQAGFPNPDRLMKDAVANMSKTSKDPVDFPASRTFLGVYRDGGGSQWQNGGGYDLTLTIWTEIK